MQDIMPSAPAGAQLIQSYGPAGFRIGGQDYATSVLVTATATLPWSGELTLETLAPLLAAPLEILLIGTGARHAMVLPVLRQEFKTREIGLDTMDTGAACRTFNILLGEGRQVAAALKLPV